MKNLPLSGIKRICRVICVPIILSLGFLSAAKIAHAQSKMVKDPDVIGRWDISIDKGGKSLPSWLEVQKSGTHTLIGRFTYAFGSARPIRKLNHMMANTAFRFLRNGKKAPVIWILNLT